MFALVAVLLVSCTRSRTVPRMVIIGIDGWGSAYLDSLPMPRIRGLMEEATCVFHKRSVLPSASSINWASTFNGLPTQLHGYTQWNSKAPAFPVADVPESGIPVTVFTLFRERYPEAKIEALYEWDGVKYSLDTLAFDVHRQTLADNATDSTTTAVIELLLKDRPDLFYVHYDAIDHAGHTCGWGSPEYDVEVAEMDRCVGRILDALREAGLYDHTYVVLVSDHGGIGKKHGGPSVEELEAPFIIAGPGIRKGYKPEEYMLQYDVAATLASVLGLDIPPYWRGRPLRCRQ